MSIRKLDEELYEAECDYCGRVEELHAESFEDAKDELKNEEGWTALRERDGWKNMCKGCQEDD